MPADRVRPDPRYERVWEIPLSERRYQRRCNMCFTWFPRSSENFGNLQRDEFGLQSRCRACMRQYQRDLRQLRRNPVRLAASANADGRAFGVEMEITGPDAHTIITALGNAGILMDRRNRLTGQEIGYQATNTDSDVWSLKHDSSVRGHGLELVSPKLRGDNGLAQVRTVCNTLKEIGATVDRTCGLHVHHDFRNMEFPSMQRQIMAFLEREDLIMRLVAPSRRTNYDYCPRWNGGSDYGRPTNWIEAFSRATSLSGMSQGPRGTLNLWAYGVHGSVELRAHAGTTRFEKIAAWVRFGQAIFAAGEAGASVSTTDVTQMLTDLIPFGLTTEDASWLLRFETAGTRAQVQERVATLRMQADLAESVLEEV
jgi:hypothetical protein